MVYLVSLCLVSKKVFFYHLSFLINDLKYQNSDTKMFERIFTEILFYMFYLVKRLLIVLLVPEGCDKLIDSACLPPDFRLPEPLPRQLWLAAKIVLEIK